MSRRLTLLEGGISFRMSMLTLELVDGHGARRTCHVDLNTITEVRRLTGKGDEDFDWQEGDSWLAGGTWLFSEPQPHLRRLLDLQGFDWEPLMVGGRDSRYPPPVRSLSCMRWKRLRSVTIRIRVR